MVGLLKKIKTTKTLPKLNLTITKTLFYFALRNTINKPVMKYLLLVYLLFFSSHTEMLLTFCSLMHMGWTELYMIRLLQFQIGIRVKYYSSQMVVLPEIKRDLKGL